MLEKIKWYFSSCLVVKLSVYLYICIFVLLSIWQDTCLVVKLYVYLSIFIFVLLSIWQFTCLFVKLSVCLFVYLSFLFGKIHVSLSNCLSVYLSICLFVLSIWQDTCLVVKLSIKQLISLRPVNTFCNISFIFVVNLTNYKFWCLDCWLTKLSLNEDKCTKNVFLFHWS